MREYEPMYRVRHIKTSRWLVDNSIYPSQHEYETAANVADTFFLSQLKEVTTYDIFDKTQWEWLMEEDDD